MGVFVCHGARDYFVLQSSLEIASLCACVSHVPENSHAYSALPLRGPGSRQASYVIQSIYRSAPEPGGPSKRTSFRIAQEKGERRRRFRFDPCLQKELKLTCTFMYQYVTSKYRAKQLVCIQRHAHNYALRDCGPGVGGPSIGHMCILHTELGTSRRLEESRERFAPLGATSVQHQ